MATLLNIADRYAEAHADKDGIAQTPIPGVAIVRSTAPTGLVHAISRPLVCLVLQGGKQVTMGINHFSFTAGDSLIITGDLPMVSQITKASAAAPYLSVVFDLDLAVIADLAVQIGSGSETSGRLVHVELTDEEVADAALRLMRLLERPEAARVLHPQLVREFHYWLLVGRHGPVVRRLAGRESQAQHVARAIAMLRADFAKHLPVERLAAVAGMSPSSFHHHFRMATSLSPLQFQKQLRLIEARRLMLSEGRSASSAAYLVGYESVPQFTRKYARMFGSPPVREVKAARGMVQAAA